MGRILSSVVAALFMLLSVQAPVIAQTVEKDRKIAGTVVFATGERSSDLSAVLKRGGLVYVGERIVTGQNGYVQLKMVDEAFFSLKPGSVLTIEAYNLNPSIPSQERVRIFLEEGILRSKTGQIGERGKQRFRLNTPVAAVGVRGTDFSIRTTSALSQAVVREGGIAISPFSESCRATGFGACEGAQVKELFADSTSDVYLELKKGAGSASLLQGRLEQLKPNVDDMFPATSSQRPQGTQSSVNTTSSAGAQSALSPEVEQLLVDALDRETEWLENQPKGDESGNVVPENLDSDRDGIANSLESWWVMDAERADSDGDGLNDLAELRRGSNPNYADFDKDGILDSEDERFATSDVVTLSDQRISLSDLQAFGISDASTATLSEETGVWTMSVVANSENLLGPNGFAVSFDPATNTWSGSADELKALDAVMSGDSWIALQKQWAVNILLDGAMTREDVEGLVSAWQVESAELIALEEKAILAKADISDLDTQRTYIYTEKALTTGLTSSASVVVNALSVDLSNQLFTAQVTLSSGQQVEVRGRAQDGVLSGRVGDVVLRGIMTGNGQLRLIVSENQHSLISNMAVNSYHNQPLDKSWVEISASANKTTKWGRWSDFAQLKEADITQLRNGSANLEWKFNKHFALSRQLLAGYELPAQGRYSFELTDYEAVHVKAGEINAAHIEHASLDIDIPANRYAMYLGVDAADLTETEVLRSYGVIDAQGRLESDDVLSDTQSAGFLGNNAGEAALLFEKQLSSDEYVSGASHWTRNN